MTEAEPSGKITASNLDLFERLVRLDGKIDLFTEMMSHQQKTAEDHEARLRELERSQNQSSGVLRFIPVALSALAALAATVAVIVSLSA